MKFSYLIFCSTLFLDINGKFINSHNAYDGETAKPYSAPYIISMKRQNTELDTPRHTCAGAILNENWILTSARCLMPINFGIVAVFAGENNITQDEGVEQIRYIAQNITHKLFSAIGNGPYDIALLRVEKPFEFNDLVKPITLPTFEAGVTGPVTLYGWGSITNETNPKVLHAAKRELVSLDECRSYKGAKVHETNFCMGPVDQDNNACVVDEGGPIVQEISGKTVLVGLSSWRTIICYPGPYVNVRVSAFIDWIDENISI